MVKLNDYIIPLVIGTIVAFVLSKKKTSFALPVINPYYTNIDNAQAKAVEKLDTNIETLQSVKESNLGIAKSILDYEKNLSDLDISKIQNELGKTQSFISQQQKVQAGSKFGLSNFSGQQLLKKFTDSWNYYSKVWTGEKGHISGVSIFPDKKLFLTQENYNLIAQQAKYEQAQENIQAASQLVLRQHGEIDRLQDEYQTRFGSLRRYG
jgi:hypothetical protein